MGVTEAIVVCHYSREDDDEEEEEEEDKGGDRRLQQQQHSNTKYIKRPDKLSTMELHTPIEEQIERYAVLC